MPISAKPMIFERNAQGKLIEQPYPKSFEEEFPEAAATLKRICQSGGRERFIVRLNHDGSGKEWLNYNWVHFGPVAPLGRNDPCPCGSGKKYKRCCLGV